MEKYRFEFTYEEYSCLSFVLDNYKIGKRFILRDRGDILSAENRRYIEKEIDDVDKLLSKLLDQKIQNDMIRDRVKYKLDKPLY